MPGKRCSRVHVSVQALQRQDQFHDAPSQFPNAVDVYSSGSMSDVVPVVIGSIGSPASEAAAVEGPADAFHAVLGDSGPAGAPIPADALNCMPSVADAQDAAPVWHVGGGRVPGSMSVGGLRSWWNGNKSEGYNAVSARGDTPVPQWDSPGDHSASAAAAQARADHDRQRADVGAARGEALMQYAVPPEPRRQQSGAAPPDGGLCGDQMV